MISTVVARSLARRQVHYSWVTLAVTFLTMLVMPGPLARLAC